MDDTKAISDKQQVKSSPSASSGQVIKSQNGQVQDLNNQPQMPSQPVSTPVKEGEPGGKSNEWLTPSSPEVAIEKELKEIGVEGTHEADDGAASQELTKVREELILSQSQPQSQTKFPLTREQVLQILKVHKKVTDSILWLAMLIKKQFQMEDKKGGA